MKYILLLIISLSFISCSPKSIENFVEKSLIASSGNKPPQSFRIANIQTMNDYVFNTKDLSFSLPSAKESDFTKMGGWDGMSMRDGKTIALGLKDSIVYHIHITSSMDLYTERESAIENGDIAYVNKLYHQYHPDKDISFQRHGKENYFCEVMEGVMDKHLYPNKEDISFGCYKFNTTRTKVKSVAVILTYNKPNDSSLAEEYTYEDLQKRSQRILDSLYIKDGWEN